jgi:hypothetical protein
MSIVNLVLVVLLLHEVCCMPVLLCFNPMHPKPLPPQGLLFLQQHQALPKGTFNAWHYPLPPHTILNRFATQISLKYFHVQQS